VRLREITIQRTIPDDLAEIGRIYARNRGFVDAGRLTAVGFKHARWRDTVLLQRSLR
jgi:L-amino acid N-acyltransferase YncA